MFKIILTLALAFSYNLFCQVNLDSLDLVTIDSLIYESKQKFLPYPFKAQIDSAQKEFSKVAQKYYNEGAFCVHPPTTGPLLFGIEYGKVVSFKDYINKYKHIFPDSCILIFELDVDWQGNISRAKLVRYKGKLDLAFDFDDFFSNIKAIPGKYAGIPQNYKMMLPIRRK